MVIVYGMTETGGIAETPIPPDAAPPGSVGQPMIDVMIADDQGQRLGPVARVKSGCSARR